MLKKTKKTYKKFKISLNFSMNLNGNYWSDIILKKQAVVITDLTSVAATNFIAAAILHYILEQSSFRSRSLQKEFRFI